MRTVGMGAKSKTDKCAECASIKAAHEELVEKYAEAEKLCAERAATIDELTVKVGELEAQLVEAQKPKK